MNDRSEDHGSVNDYGQPIGPALPGFTPRPRLTPTTIGGTHVTLSPMDPDAHAGPLHAALGGPEHAHQWTYMMSAPSDHTADACEAYLRQKAADPEHSGFAITHNGTGSFAGLCALIRHRPEHGSVEVGHIIIAPEFQRSAVLTNTVYLLAKHAFDRGYRRFEWKCDALNERSMRAAHRLGFRYEGTFRNDLVYKGRSRDTAWFSITDADWARLEPAYLDWLDPGNFDATGAPRSRLMPSAD